MIPVLPSNTQVEVTLLRTVVIQHLIEVLRQFILVKIIVVHKLVDVTAQMNV
jgi:hypothetical protein